MNSRANKMEVLKMEYTQVCNKLLYLDDQANKYVSYMLTTIAALAAFLQFLVKDSGISDYINFSLLISAGTLIMGLLIIMTMHHTVQCFRLGGYIRFLEDEINREIDCELLQWENIIASKYIHKDITTAFIYIIMGFVFFVLLIGAGYVSVRYILPKWPFIAYMIFCIILLEIVAAVIYLAKALSEHEKMFAVVSHESDVKEKVAT